MNFDSTKVGVPYSRVMKFFADYASEKTTHIDVILQRHARMEDGTHEPLGSSKTLTFDVLPEELMTGEVELLDFLTGEPLGKKMSKFDLFTGMASLIREKELAAGAAANPPAEA